MITDDSMLSQVTFNREKWMNAVILDPITGLDPPDVKVRAAQGPYFFILRLNDVPLRLTRDRCRLVLCTGVLDLV